MADVIAVWPCNHGSVLVEPGPARPGYKCAQCGATATTYVAIPDTTKAAHAIAQALCHEKHGDWRYDPGDSRYDKWLARGRRALRALEVPGA